jgi:L-iditol 2-dehydrogenase
MKAAILNKPKELVIKDIAKPQCGDNEVLINIKEVGVCGSDVHYYNKGRIGDFVVKKPIILGHESSGIISEVGDKVRGFEVGDRVTIEPGVPCYTCDYCIDGNYNLCPNIVFMATPPYDGAFVEYITYDPNFVYKLPDNISLTAAALIEPLSVGYSASKRAKIKPGDNVLILGSGPIGISILEMVKAFGASKVYITDINDFRLGVAKKHGAYKTINVTKKDIFGELKNVKIDSIIEASGAENSIINSIKLVRPGGAVVWVGMGKDDIRIPYSIITSKDLSIEGIFRYKNTYPSIISLLEGGKIKIEDIVTHYFKLDDIEKAFSTANDPDVDRLKIVIRI